MRVYHDEGRPYSRVVRRQLEVAADPELTPAALMLARMREYGVGFMDFADHMSRAHHAYFDELILPSERRHFFSREAADSHGRQQMLEEADDRPFDQFLEEYFAQRESKDYSGQKI